MNSQETMIKDEREFPFTIIDNSILEDESLTAYEKIIYAVLCKFANQKNNTCFPSITTIQKLAGCGKMTVIRGIKKLEERNYIKKEKRQHEHNREYATNLYSILDLHHQEMIPGGTKTEEKGSTKMVSPGLPGGHELDPLIIKDNNSRSPRVFSVDFEKFWKEYPRKVEKVMAYKCWIARLKDEIKPKDMIQSAKNYAKRCREEKKEQQYIKHPKTFLGPNRVWEEYLDAGAMYEGEEAEFADYGVSSLGWLPELRDMTLEEHLADLDDFCERLIKKNPATAGTSAEAELRANFERQKQEAREGKLERPKVEVKRNEISRV